MLPTRKLTPESWADTFFGSHETRNIITLLGQKTRAGTVPGAADDDPSGIATYSQAGAQFGFSMLWTVLFTYPLMVAIQIISTRIGRVNGHGLATNVRQQFPAWLLHGIVGLLLIANTINIAADIAAMGDALKLMVGGPKHLYAILSGTLSLILQIFIPYTRYVRVLKWLTLALLSYVATAFVVHIPWAEVLTRTLLPHFSWQQEYITTMVAVFGTTISPYLFSGRLRKKLKSSKPTQMRGRSKTPRTRLPPIFVASGWTPASAWRFPMWLHFLSS